MATMCDDLFSLRLLIHDRLDGEGLLFIDFYFCYTMVHWYISLVVFIFWIYRLVYLIILLKHDIA